MTALVGTPFVEASVTSGTVSATTAITDEHIIINGVNIGALGAAANAAARVDALVAAINAKTSESDVTATELTSTTFKLTAPVDIVIELDTTATAATCGLTEATTEVARVLLDTRKQFGKNVTPGDEDLILVGKQEIRVRDAKNMGLLKVTEAGSIGEVQKAQTPTRVDAVPEE